MAASIKHKKVATVPDSPDYEINSSEWNDEHDVSGLQETLQSGVNIKTVCGKSILGSGNVDISAGDVGADPAGTADDATALHELTHYHPDQDLSTTASPEFADVQITTLAADSVLGNVAKSVLSLLNKLVSWVKNIATATKDPTGFVSPELVTVTGDGAARNVTLTGTLDYMWRGRLVQPVSPWTPTATPHADDPDGTVHYLYSTDGQTFAWSTTVWSFDAVHVARHIKVGGVNFYFREPHGTIPWQSHFIQHHDPLGGAFRVSGGSVVGGTYTLNADGNAAVTPDFAEAVIRDEDLPSTIPAVAAGQYSHAYFSGSRVLNLAAAQALPYRVGPGGYPYINGQTGGNFTDTEASQNRYINVYQILVPVAADATSQGVRMQFLQPQAQYTSLAAAQAEDPFTLDVLGFGGFGVEQVVWTRLTYQTNAAFTATGKVRLVATAEIRTKLNVAGNATAATTAENVTTGTFDGNLAGATTVEAALQLLDNASLGGGGRTYLVDADLSGLSTYTTVDLGALAEDEQFSFMIEGVFTQTGSVALRDINNTAINGMYFTSLTTSGSYTSDAANRLFVGGNATYSDLGATGFGKIFRDKATQQFNAIMEQIAYGGGNAANHYFQHNVCLATTEVRKLTVYPASGNFAAGVGFKVWKEKRTCL